MSEPRKWWLAPSNDNPHNPMCGLTYLHTEKKAGHIHVIEYSAYAELLAKLEAAEKEIERLKIELKEASNV